MKLRAASLLAACALLSACQSGPRPAGAPGPSAPASAVAPASAAWLRTELYFGIAPAEAEGLGLSAAEGTWRSFLDEEVTPRFPDGFTVFEAYGQWRADAASEIERERSRVLVILHPDTAAIRAALEAIRAAYRERTGAQSVLAVEIPVPAPRF